MDLQSYCDNVQIELMAWKARVYDVVRKMDKLSTGERGKTVPMIRDLYNLVDELGDRVGQLEKECPTAWDPHKKEIEGVMSKLRDNWKAAWGSVSQGNIGG